VVVAIVCVIVIAFVALAGIQEYKARKAEAESLSPGELRKWNDPNYEIIPAGLINYTDYGIGPVYLLPLDTNDIDDAIFIDSVSATQPGAERWAGGSNGRPTIAWDFRWELPKKFKVWWFRIVDEEAARAAHEGYDRYTMRETRPGGAWCEAEISVHGHPSKEKSSSLLLSFYPDGHVEGEIDDPIARSARPGIDKRNVLPRLAGQACMREIPNPFYGKTRPRSFTIN
jgi:hypothetical protein